jgi:hypothetical protein
MATRAVARSVWRWTKAVPCWWPTTWETPRRAFERSKGWKADVIIAGPIVRFPEAFADCRSGASQELVNSGVLFVRVTRLDGPSRHHARRQPLALVNVENRVFAQHRDDAGFLFVISILGLQLLDEIDLRAVFALADMAAQFRGLPEDQIPRRAVAGVLRHPKRTSRPSASRNVRIGFVLQLPHGEGTLWKFHAVDFCICSQAPPRLQRRRVLRRHKRTQPGRFGS